MAIYFITGNKNKFTEANKILPNIRQLDIDLPELQEIDAKKVIKAKLIEALKYKPGEFIVEDTSLYLSCLNGLPGPLIKWFVITMGNKGLFNMVKKLGNTSAEAKTIIGYAKNPSKIYYFNGRLKGKIVFPRGKSGFGWDSIFQPEGFTKTLAELTLKEKNKISMRRVAFNKLKKFIATRN